MYPLGVVLLKQPSTNCCRYPRAAEQKATHPSCLLVPWVVLVPMLVGRLPLVLTLPLTKKWTACILALEQSRT